VHSLADYFANELVELERRDRLVWRQRQIAQQIGKSQTDWPEVVAAWRRFGDSRANQRPRFADAVRASTIPEMSS
jgi:hypothetical protein